MHEFWHQEFIWFCEQNSEFWKGCPKFRSWWQLWQDEAEKTPISGDENWSCDKLVLAVCTDECTTYSRRVPPETCGFCTLPQTRASPPSMVEKTFSTPEKGGSWPLRAAGGSLALGEGGPGPVRKAGGSCLRAEGSCTICHSCNICVPHIKWITKFKCLNCNSCVIWTTHFKCATNLGVYSLYPQVPPS